MNERSPRPNPARLAGNGSPGSRPSEPARSQPPKSRGSKAGRPGEIPAAGPLGKLLRVTWRGGDSQRPTLEGAAADANALILLRGTAFAHVTEDGVTLPDEAVRALLDWAARHSLGQRPGSVKGVAARRSHALRHLRDQGLAVRRVRLEPEWRLAVGLGEKANPHEIGTALHGGYGWPVIPGSTLKGAAAQRAWDTIDRQAPAERDTYARVFGAPLRRDRAKESGEQPEAAGGRVRFLDALPAGECVTVTVDVLTPHVKPYYDRVTGPGPEDAIPPPAEYHQPVSVPFLTVSAGVFEAALVGDSEEETEHADRWLRDAVRENGLGAKTSAGYGYLTTTETE